MKNEAINPHDLKSMSIEELEELAHFCRREIIAVTSANGGHLSSNLGACELTIALVKVFDPLKDDILFDVGHQTYTYKMITGRDIKTIRLKDGLAPFLDPRESPYDKYEPGHSSTSISTALGMSVAKELKKDDSYTIAVIGDASIVNGLSLEGLNALSDINPSKTIIILNENGMSIGKTSGGYSCPQSDISLLFKSLGIEYIGPLDGHDIKNLIEVFNNVKKLKGPLVVHVMTQKGHGYSPAQDDEIGYWHGVTPFDPVSLKPIDMHPGLISFSHAKSDFLYDILNEDDKAILINPAMVKGAGEEKLFETFKDRCFDVGISEEHAFTFASGLALKGLHPIISIYSTFFQRAFDECFHDISHQRLAATVILERSGLVGQDGETHQGIYDLPLLYTIPKAMIYEPYDYESLYTVMNECSKFKELSFVRLARELTTLGTKEHSEPYKMIDNNSDTIVICFGSLGKQIYESDLSCDKLLTYIRHDFDSKIMNFITKHKRVIVYDSTSIINGFSSHFAYSLLKHGFNGEYIVHAIPNSFISHAKRSEQLIDLKLDYDHIYQTIKELL